MKLLQEFIDFSELEVIKEDVEGSEKKDYFLKGPFLQAEVKNKNGRRYLEETLLREVKEFCETKIKTHRSMGELDHPPDPTINLDRVSHIITELYMKDKIGHGIAKLINTPMGRIAKTLVDEGILLGMSTRGIGTLEGEYVKEDYKLITIDIVADPSAPSAFVEGVMENKEYIIGDDGNIVEVAVKKLQKKVEKKSNKFKHKEVSALTLSYMLEFIEDVRKKSM